MEFVEVGFEFGDLLCEVVLYVGAFCLYQELLELVDVFF